MHQGCPIATLLLQLQGVENVWVFTEHLPCGSLVDLLETSAGPHIERSATQLQAMHVLRQSWRRRLTIMRDIAFALAQCHEGRLDPGTTQAQQMRARPPLRVYVYTTPFVLKWRRVWDYGCAAPV